MPDETTASQNGSAINDRIERLLQSRILRWLAAPVVVLIAIVVGQYRGLPVAVLVLACGMLLLVIWLLWNSLQGLTGETPMSLEEALGLGAPSAEEEQKRAVLRALKDLEYERSVGKISDEDYTALTSRYRTEAKVLLRSLDENLAPNRDLAEKLLEQRLAEETPGGTPSRGRAEKKKKKKSKESRPADEEPEAADIPDEEEEAEATSAPEPELPAEKPEAASGTPAARKPTRRCDKCETRNDLDARFCKGCGAAMAAEDQALCSSCPALYDKSLDACPDCGVPREDA
jgi:hypothetical protein